MGHLFCDCREVESLDVSSFDTSGTENMSMMFGDCSGLFVYLVNAETIFFGDNFSTEGVTHMDLLFYMCYSLRSLDLSGFTIGEKTNTENMLTGTPETIASP